MAKGIDVSYANGEIDWGKVKAAGIEFAMIRLGYGSNISTQDDKRFIDNVNGCVAHGIDWGAYIYSYALTTAEAMEETKHALRLLKGLKPTYPIAFDMEDADNYKKNHGMPSNKTLVDICETFLSIMEANKYYVSLYASKSWFSNQLNSIRLNRFDKWLAHWNVAKPSMECGIWQKTDKGIVNGILGFVDLNESYKDYPEIIVHNGLNGYDAATETPLEPSTSESGSEEIIRVFKPTDKNFKNNGDKIIKPFKAIVHKEDNGDYYLNLEASTEYIKYFEHDNIIVAPTPTGAQAFRINNPQVKKNRITTKCWHVYYDSQNYIIKDTAVTDVNCNSALDWFNTKCDQVTPFKTISDVTCRRSYRCRRHTLTEAIETIIDRWGGHLVRDNFNIAIKETIGRDNGIVIRYGKNLNDFTCQYNWDKVVTKLMPVGKKGILLKDDPYIYTDVEYEIPYTKAVHFNQDNIEEDKYKDIFFILDKEKYEAALRDDLREKALKYIEENKFPKVNYMVKSDLNEVTDVGDVIHVIDESLGINLETNVIAFDYDCILGKYISVEFGNFKKQLSGLMDDIATSTGEVVEKETQKISLNLDSRITEIGNKIWSVLGDSNVIYDGDKILVVDKLPKETANNVILINSGGIAFGQNGINGPFNSAWSIDGTLNMQSIDCINFTADIIKGGTLKLGGLLNGAGKLELYSDENELIGEISRDGIKIYGTDGSYVLMNNEEGFAGYDMNDNKIYWAAKDEFHMKKSIAEEEITLCNKMRFIPITITEEETIVSDGIGLVSTLN